MKPLIFLLLALSLCSCSNQFAYKENKWKQVSQAQQGSRQVIYVDENRVKCKEGKCLAWTKMIFAQEQAIPYGGKKSGQESGYLMVKRIDSSVEYDCNTGLAQIISYQLYDQAEQMIDSKWIDFAPIKAQPGTVHGDVFKYLCKKNPN